jgi:hypothetical protein
MSRCWTLGEISGAAATLSLLLDRDARKSLQEQQALVADACASTNPQDWDSAREACLEALHDLQRLIDGALADMVGR